MRWPWFAIYPALLAACTDVSPGGPDASSADAGVTVADGGDSTDAGGEDAATPPDAGSDAGVSDAGPVCADVGPARILTGTFTVENVLDLEMLAPYTEVTGSVTLDAPGLAIFLPNLQRVGGDLTSRSTAESIDLPALEHVGGDVTLRGSPTLDLTCLQSAASLTTYDVQDVRLQSLATTGGLTLSSAREVDAAGLVSVDYLHAGCASYCDFDDLQTVAGVLSVSGTTASNIRFPKLTSIGGDATMSGPVAAPLLASIGNSLDAAGAISLDSLEFIPGDAWLSGVSAPALTEIGGNVVRFEGAVDAPMLRRVQCSLVTIAQSFPSLTTIGDGFDCYPDGVSPLTIVPGGSVASFPALTAIEDGALSGDLIYVLVVGTTATEVNFGSLEYLWGTIYVESNADLTVFTAPDLADSGVLYFAGNAALASLQFPSLTQIRGYLQVDDNPALERVDVPALATARSGVDSGGMSVLPYIAIQNNEALTELDFSVLSATPSVLITNNALLPEISFPFLTHAPVIRINDNTELLSLSAPMLTETSVEPEILRNPMLPACDREAILVQTGYATPSGTCP